MGDDRNKWVMPICLNINLFFFYRAEGIAYLLGFAAEYGGLPHNGASGSR